MRADGVICAKNIIYWYKYSVLLLIIKPSLIKAGGAETQYDRHPKFDIKIGIKKIKELKDFIRAKRPDIKIQPDKDPSKQYFKTTILIGSDFGISVIYIALVGDIKNNHIFETALYDLKNNNIIYDKKYGYDDVLTFKTKEEVVKEIDRVIKIHNHKK